MSRRSFVPSPMVTGPLEAGESGYAAARSSRGFFLILALALLICAFLKVPTLHYPHAELDERIYWQLAENLAQKGQYSLQGTELLGTLPPGIFNHPLFHHPPLFATLLIPFVLVGAKDAAVVASWLGHLLAVLAVALVGRHALRRSVGANTFTSPVFWVPLLGICTDPLLLFVSR